MKIVVRGTDAFVSPRMFQDLSVVGAFHYDLGDVNRVDPLAAKNDRRTGRLTLIE